MAPGELFTKLLKDNNLFIQLAPQKIRKIDDGSLIIENPVLNVDWIVQPTEEPVIESAPVTTVPETTTETPTAAEVASDGKDLNEPTTA